MKSVSLFLAAWLLCTISDAQCPAINVTGVVTDASCYNYKNGSVTLSVSGGTGPYTYKWSNLSLNKDLQTVYAGNYSVEVTDAAGCKATQSFTIGQPAEVVISTVSGDPGCSNSANGFITPSATGGTGPYTFVIEGGGNNFSNLGPGRYDLLAADSRGCIGRATVTLDAPDPIQILAISSKKYLGYDISCAGGNNGEITINAIGGTGDLQYAVSGGSFQPSNTISGLSAGTYVITVKDENGCTLSNDYQSMIDNPGIIISPPVTLIAPAPMELSPIIVNPWALLGGFPNTMYFGYGPQWVVLSAGEITGGTGTNFSYLWSNNTGAPLSHPTEQITQSTPTATTVYTLTVTDQNGCVSSIQTTINVVDARCGPSNNKNQKVLMCHNGTEICVSLNSLSMSQHLAHGDRIGPCSFVTAMTGVSSRRIEDAGNSLMLQDELAPVLEVHPNPSVGIFQVKMETGIRTEIQVVDASGVVIERRIGGNKSLEAFDLSGKPAGLYFIKTISAEGVRSTKLWVKR